MPTIKTFRAEAGLSQKALADAADINIRLLQKYEAGECRIDQMTLGTASRLAQALGISIEDLLPEA